ncbi:hypothetical protein B0H12DRAFT_1100850 [Mycena haematopus]|nr:hypothetical protein B0H12DRAFT_1100850 [Mycena haematopus]
MPSASTTLVVSALAFVCGQLFDALCMNSHPIKLENASSMVTVFSFRTLVAVVPRVLSILFVHGSVLLLRRYLFGSEKHQASGTFKFDAANSPAPSNDFRRSPTEFPILASPCRRHVSHRSPLEALAPAAIHPLLEDSTAPAPAADRVASSTLLSVSLTAASGPGTQDCKSSVTLNEDAISICRAHIKEEVNAITESLSDSLRRDERIQPSPAQDIPVNARHSQVPLLLLIAAAAQLRRLRAKAVEELCDAEIVGDVKFVEKIYDVEAHADKVAEDIMQTLVVEASSSDAKIIEDGPGDHAFGIPLIEELDGVPTYEEFAEDAPMEPLFEKSAFTPLVHIIHRPPSLALLAVRVSVKPRSEHIPRLSLLARLFSRRRKAGPISA